MGAPLPSGSFQEPIPATVTPGASWLYVTGEDALCCTVFNAAAGVTVTVTGRILEFGDVRPKPFAQTLTPATDRSASVVRYSIGDGWLLNAQVLVSSGTPGIGQTFARLSLVRGTTSNALDLFTLAAGYVTAKMPLSYPGSGVLASVEGAGALRSITGATPAAGGEISETVPTGARWELLALTATLTPSGTVANRDPTLVFDDGANVYAKSDMHINEPTGSVWINTWFQGANSAGTLQASAAQAPIGIGLRLAAGHRIRTSTIAIQVADQWSAIQYLVREWIEGA